MAGRKRSNGEGSYWQLRDRTWVHQITVGRKPDGSLERKSFKGKTKAICNLRKAEWLAQREAETAEIEKCAQEATKDQTDSTLLGHAGESEILFKDAFLPWLSLYKAPPIRKPSTYSGYIDIYTVHFEAVFGDYPLYQITQDMVQEYYQSLQHNGARKDGKRGGLSPKTIRNHHMLLKDFFAYAMKKYKLPANPAEDTSRPEVPVNKMRVLSLDEMQIFIREVMRETQRIAILTDLFLGLRVGELLALEIDDLDLDQQTISINKNLIRVSTKVIAPDTPGIRILNYSPQKKTHLIVQDTPKTKSSNREIHISDDLCELLVRHLFTLAHSSWPNPDNLLFPSTTGTHIDPKSFENRLKAVSKRCEIRKVNPHALRHTLATRLVENHTPLNIVKDILGHSSITTTQKYLHGNAELERQALSGMSDYLSIGTLSETKQFSSAGFRGKFADIDLPNFSREKANRTA